MKKLLLACCLVAAAATAYAQPPGAATGPTSDQRLTYMQKSLQLTDAQAKQVKPILDASSQQRHALMDKYKPQFKAFRDEMKSLKDQTHTPARRRIDANADAGARRQRDARKHFRGGHHHPGANGHRPGASGKPAEPAPAAE